METNKNQSINQQQQKNNNNNNNGQVMHFADPAVSLVSFVSWRQVK